MMTEKGRSLAPRAGNWRHSAPQRWRQFSRPDSTKARFSAQKPVFGILGNYFQARPPRIKPGAFRSSQALASRYFPPPAAWILNAPDAFPPTLIVRVFDYFTRRLKEVSLKGPPTGSSTEICRLVFGSRRACRRLRRDCRANVVEKTRTAAKASTAAFEGLKSFQELPQPSTSRKKHKGPEVLPSSQSSFQLRDPQHSSPSTGCTLPPSTKDRCVSSGQASGELSFLTSTYDGDRVCSAACCARHQHKKVIASRRERNQSERNSSPAVRVPSNRVAPDEQQCIGSQLSAGTERCMCEVSPFWKEDVQSALIDGQAFDDAAWCKFVCHTLLQRGSELQTSLLLRLPWVLCGRIYKSKAFVKFVMEHFSAAQPSALLEGCSTCLFESVAAAGRVRCCRRLISRKTSRHLLERGLWRKRRRHSARLRCREGRIVRSSEKYTRAGTCREGHFQFVEGAPNSSRRANVVSAASATESEHPSLQNYKLASISTWSPSRSCRSLRHHKRLRLAALLDARRQATVVAKCIHGIGQLNNACGIPEETVSTAALKLVDTFLVFRKRQKALKGLQRANGRDLSVTGGWDTECSATQGCVPWLPHPRSGVVEGAAISFPRDIECEECFRLWSFVLSAMARLGVPVMNEGLRVLASDFELALGRTDLSLLGERSVWRFSREEMSGRLFEAFGQIEKTLEVSEETEEAKKTSEDGQLDVQPVIPLGATFLKHFLSATRAPMLETVEAATNSNAPVMCHFIAVSQYKDQPLTKTLLRAVGRHVCIVVLSLARLPSADWCLSALLFGAWSVSAVSHLVTPPFECHLLPHTSLNHRNSGCDGEAGRLLAENRSSSYKRHAMASYRTPHHNRQHLSSSTSMPLSKGDLGSLAMAIALLCASPSPLSRHPEYVWLLSLFFFEVCQSVGAMPAADADSGQQRVGKIPGAAVQVAPYRAVVANVSGPAHVDENAQDSAPRASGRGEKSHSSVDATQGKVATSFVAVPESAILNSSIAAENRKDGECGSRDVGSITLWSPSLPLRRQLSMACWSWASLMSELRRVSQEYVSVDIEQNVGIAAPFFLPPEMPVECIHSLSYALGELPPERRRGGFSVNAFVPRGSTKTSHQNPSASATDKLASNTAARSLLLEPGTVHASRLERGVQLALQTILNEAASQRRFVTRRNNPRRSEQREEIGGSHQKTPVTTLRDGCLKRHRPVCEGIQLEGALGKRSNKLSQSLAPSARCRIETGAAVEVFSIDFLISSAC